MSAVVGETAMMIGEMMVPKRKSGGRREVAEGEVCGDRKAEL